MDTILEIPVGHSVFRVSGHDPAERLGRLKKEDGRKYTRCVLLLFIRFCI